MPGLTESILPQAPAAARHRTVVDHPGMHIGLLTVLAGLVAAAVCHHVGVIGVASHDTICERSTGGTCFLDDCVPWRHAECSFSIKTAGWHACECPRGLCAVGGACVGAPEPYSLQAWLRTESYTPILLVMVYFGRSGAQDLLKKALGLDKILGVADTREITYFNTVPTPTEHLSSCIRGFSELSQDMGFTWWQAIVASTAKLMFWHLAQPLFFFTAFFAYVELMGPWQRCFATAVVANELWYVMLLARGLVHRPGFLLFAPLSERRVIMKVLYCLAPAEFVWMSSQDPDAPVSVIARVALAGFALGTPWCALGALVVGMTGAGVSSPALCFGYILAVLQGVPIWCEKK